MVSRTVSFTSAWFGGKMANGKRKFSRTSCEETSHFLIILGERNCG